MEAQTTAAKAKREVEVVKMTDGRLVEFAGKRRMLKESFVTDGKVQTRLDFRNGETRLFTVPDSLLLKFAGHGAEQKLGDEPAGLKGTDGGEPDLDDVILCIDELIDRLYNGEWNTKREAGGLAGTSVLMRALVEFSGKPVEVVKAKLAAMSQAEKLALRNNPKIKPIVQRIEDEKAAKSAGKNVDTEALLSGFGV